MSAQDLAGYKFQLEQVTEALVRNPENAELIKLQSDLKELISLASTLLESENSKQKNPPPKVTKQPVNTIQPGQLVRARWKDGNFYDAIVEEVTNIDPKAYRVRFQEYGALEVGQEDISKNDEASIPRDPNLVVPKAPVTPATTTAFVMRPITAKKKKYKAKVNKGMSKNEMQQHSKQQNWLSFVTSSASRFAGKDKKPSAPLRQTFSKPSMFSTAENPAARVGVIGSGKPMTQFGRREKHVFLRQ